MPRKKGNGPGPAGYRIPSTIGGHDITKRKAPGFSFGLKLAPKTTPSPGPQTYAPDAKLTKSGRSHSASYHMGSPPTPAKARAPSPGPGRYAADLSVQKQVLRRRPAHRIGLPIPILDPRRHNPGPLDYDTLEDRRRPRSPAFRISSTVTKDVFTGQAGPGPAHYNVNYECCTPTAKSYSIQTGFLDLGRCKVGPGPGKYSPDKLACCSPKSPAWSIQGRHPGFFDCDN